jgi:hypothetical protein
MEVIGVDRDSIREEMERSATDLHIAAANS